jgi:hypothetical protein
MAILLSGILLLAICTPAVAQETGAVAGNSSWLSQNLPWLSHMAMTVGGVGLAMRWAYDAFGRREVNVADVPTFPKYMTSPQQYRLGSLIFVVFASAFFLLLVYRHKEVVAVAQVFGEGLSKDIIAAVETDAAPYLLVVAAMASVYLFCLKKEADWNVLLKMRDAIHSWISIPQLAGEIVAQIRFSMNVPADAVTEVVRNSPEVLEQDFHKNRNTPERIWAETCYMKWRLTQGQGAGYDAIFFTEKSFGYDDLLRQLEDAATRMRAWKDGGRVDPLAVIELVKTIKELHNKLSRLIACYLVYRNASSEALRAEAKKFGIDLRSPVATENPMRFWIVYIIALMASVYLGVYASGIAYDLMTGAGLNVAQDPGRAQTWALYSLSNYGVAIIAVLLLRVVSPYLGLGLHQTHLITYCWTFAIAFVTGPFGLTIAVYLFGPANYHWMTFVQIFYEMLQWGFGPALVAVYISYYLDRQTCHDLPDIDHSSATVGWRLLNCIGFAAITLFLLLPPLLAIEAQAGEVWDVSKLRFVASGTVFLVALGLAIAAQFALRKGTKGATGATSGGQGHVAPA